MVPKSGLAGSTQVGPKAPMPSASTLRSANQPVREGMDSSGVVVGKDSRSKISPCSVATAQTILVPPASSAPMRMLSPISG